MKKNLLLCLLLMLGTLCLNTRAEATLINRGTDTLGNRLIYDNDLDITWYDFSNDPDLWQNQVDWASALTVIFNSTPLGGWRLPATVDGPFVFGFDGTTTAGFNIITNSEMGHLYYTELGNLGFFATDGTNPQPGWGLTNTGPFQNLNNIGYWTGTDFTENENLVWIFDFLEGFKGVGSSRATNSKPALAVRSGDVSLEPIPEPTTIALLGIGLAGLAGAEVRRRRKKKAINS